MKSRCYPAATGYVRDFIGWDLIVKEDGRVDLVVFLTVLDVHGHVIVG